MRIHIRADGKKLNLIFPTALVFNRLTASFISKQTENPATITAARLTKLFRTVRQYKKTHPSFLLVEVQSADGDIVIIKL